MGAKRARRPKAPRTAARLTVLARFPDGQRFACRDCPARCCRMPWGIRFGPGEAERYLAEPWIAAHVGDEGLAVLRRGVLPMREVDRRPQCVFLDDEGLCGLQKRFGHDYIPRACQTFPFGFMAGEDDRPVAQLSRLCPSVRDDHGEPALAQLPGKLAEHGEPPRMSTALATLHGVHLSRDQYLRVATRWHDELDRGAPPLQVLAELFDWTQAFEGALPPDREKVDDDAVGAALTRADAAERPPLAARRRDTWRARLFFAHLFGSLSYPSRVALEHRLGKTPLLRTRSLLNKLGWLLGWGHADLLLVPQPVPLRRVTAVARIDGEVHHLALRSFLQEAILRRRLFAEPRHLQSCLLDLAFATLVACRFARCRAAAAGQGSASEEDLAEGIGIAELLFISHTTRSETGPLLKTLAWQLVTHRDRLRGVLASEL